MQFSPLVLFMTSIACFIYGKYIIASVLFGVFFILFLGPRVKKMLPGNEDPIKLKTEQAIPQLTEQFKRYGKTMSRYKTVQAKGPHNGWVMPSRKAILLVDRFLQFKRPDIPLEMLCEGIEEDLSAYDRSGGRPPISNQKMEARLRLLSALAQSSNSGPLKEKISHYIKEAESRGASFNDGIMTNPLPVHMI